MSFQCLLDSLAKRSGSLFSVTLPNGIDIPFRLPAVKEALQYRLLLDNSLDDFHTCLIYEHIFDRYIEDDFLKENDDLHAGIVETIASLILYLSGVDKNYEQYTEELLIHYRQSTNTLYNFMKRSICSVFPGYKFSDLESLDYQDLVYIYTQVEPTLLQQGIIDKELTLKKEEVKKMSISETIARDNKEYEQWNRGEEGQKFNLKDIVEQQEKQEQQKQITERQEKQKQALAKLKQAKYKTAKRG
jgi:hypothetical protein